MAMALRRSISGTFDHQTIEELTYPVAWQAWISPAERAEQEGDRRALYDEARACLWGDLDAVAVVIVDGEVVSVVAVADDDEPAGVEDDRERGA